MHAARKQVVAGSILDAGLIFFFSRSGSAPFSFVLCCKHNERPRLMQSFMDVHENCRNLVSTQFLMFSLAREPVTQQCGTIIANATPGKKASVLVKLPANLALALLHNEKVTDSSNHKVCKRVQRAPTCRAFTRSAYSTLVSISHGHVIRWKQAPSNSDRRKS